MKVLLKNPVTLWLRWLWISLRLKRANRKASLELKYLAKAAGCTFGRYNTLYESVELSGCSLGDFTYVAAGSRLANVTLGKFSSVGPEVLAGLGRHPSHTYVSTHPMFYSTKLQAQVTFATDQAFEEFRRIEIGHDVWVGARAVILDGVRIGDGAIVGAGAVVTKDVPAYAVVVGAPAQVVRYRFTDEQIRFLQEFRWWDKEEDWLRRQWRSFADITNFTDGP